MQANLKGGKKMMERIMGFVKEENGQGMAEYGLILVLVAVAVIGAFTLLAGGIEGVLGNVSDTLVPTP
jgi:pilus assembly protein Flp/PilA